MAEFCVIKEELLQQVLSAWKKKGTGPLLTQRFTRPTCVVLVSVLCVCVLVLCTPLGLSIATTMGQARPTYVARRRGPGVMR